MTSTASLTSHQAQFIAFARPDFGPNMVISDPDARGFVTFTDPDTGYHVAVGATAADGFIVNR